LKDTKRKHKNMFWGTSIKLHKRTPQRK